MPKTVASDGQPVTLGGVCNQKHLTKPLNYVPT